MRCSRGRPIRSSRSARGCSHRMWSWCRRSRKARTPTRPASPRRPWGWALLPCSSGAAASGASFTITSPLPSSGGVVKEGSVTVRATVLAALLAVGTVSAQVAAPKTEPPPKLTFAQIGLFIYPAKGQDVAQQKKDEDACYEWAEANTGLTLAAGKVDADAAGKAAAKDAGQGRVAGGAAIGAATGLAIGAIAGDAGKGAAIGAVAGSVGGVRGRINARQAAGQKGAQQAVQENQQAVDQFKKAAGACLEARGYSVR